MENKIIVGNMKMYMNYKDALAYINDLQLKSPNVIMCPTSIYADAFLKNGYKTGLQNITEHDLGAYTGEISTLQAKSMGIEYVIVGHSERRKYFNETDELVNKKIKNAIANNLKVIVCIGEEQGANALQVTKEQLEVAFRDINDLSSVIIAYEPIWAIGTNVIPTNNQIDEIAVMIKAFVKKTYNSDIKVLYGGSINASNIQELNKITNIDGFLVGKASTNAVDFKKIIEVTLN